MSYLLTLASRLKAPPKAPVVAAPVVEVHVVEVPVVEAPTVEVQGVEVPVVEAPTVEVQGVEVPVAAEDETTPASSEE